MLQFDFARHNDHNLSIIHLLANCIATAEKKIYRENSHAIIHFHLPPYLLEWIVLQMQGLYVDVDLALAVYFA